MDDDEEEAEDRANGVIASSSGTSSLYSESAQDDDKIPDIVANAFSHYGRRASMLSSITEHFHTAGERRESMLSHYSASDRARLAKLTTIVSGAETGEEPDEIHQAQHHHHHHHHQHRSNSMSPKLGRSSLRFTPLEPTASDERTPLRAPTEPRALEEAAETDAGDDDDDDDASSDGSACVETHMLLDPATELDPIADLELPHDSAGHLTTNWYTSAWTEAKVLCKSAAPIFGTQLLEYSLPLASVISIGHLSTTDLAASALANMTAAVTGYSILQGFISSRTFNVDGRLPRSPMSRH